MAENENTKRGPCPVCELQDQSYEEDLPSDRMIIHCSNCGSYRIMGTYTGWLQDLLGGSKRKRATLSHAIRKMQRDDKIPELHTGNIELILEAESLPRPAEQASILLLSLGNELEEKGYGAWLEVEPETRRAEIGAIDCAGVDYVVRSLRDSNLIEENRFSHELTQYRLTFAGWARYEELRRATKDSRTAFMAMKFGDAELDAFFRDHFKRAVEATGFDLRRLDEKPEAGIIDVRMEVEIRKARFLVADLTDGNRGVYWEAGFASGLDKPVIYTCRHDRTKDIHFDTRNRLFVEWDPEDTGRAEEMLKATIRATLPTEAKMEDE